MVSKKKGYASNLKVHTLLKRLFIRKIFSFLPLHDSFVNGDYLEVYVDTERSGEVYIDRDRRGEVYSLFGAKVFQ